MYISKNDFELDSNLHPHQPDIYLGIEVAAILKPGMFLDHSAFVALY